MKNLNLKRGFTLIELLIVISIIGILAVAFLPSLMGAPSKARDTQRLADVQKLEKFIVVESLSGGMNGFAGPECIKLGGTGFINNKIKNSLADFGGIYPSDPDNTNIVSTGCTGGYNVIEFTPGATTYSYGIASRVENFGSANINCASIMGTTDPTLNSATESPVPTGGWCYFSLIQ